jgi:hypothetical protein
MLPEQLQRVIRRQMFQFMQQYVPQIFVASFEQKVRKHDRWSVQLPAEGAVQFMTNQHDR